jgi:hypothetical protein
MDSSGYDAECQCLPELLGDTHDDGESPSSYRPIKRPPSDPSRIALP